ncbi:ABC transporter permease [Nocardioides sp.]|uniref:ABC transporter permease n=1 Tax=Nocardioides sp. TaxID=35761 RepID=UPI002C9FEB81|nr:ABC transporter permease [Nocardioides sp.]HXH79040.1 ABC transporter permease [Nocardioides sp.]
MAERTGVIHDIGYRGYDGPREGMGSLALTLYVTGLRHAFGLGRSGRSKVLPFLLLGLAVVPSVIVVGVVTMIGLDSLPLSYAAYLNQIQMLVTLFAAAQAPVLFSRDLRHRSIVLYLARPLPPALFALTRWASLATAILVFTLLPTFLLYVGGLLAGLDTGEETPVFLRSVALQLLLAALLAGIAGLISSVALRRGFAVVASIVALIVVAGVVLIVQEIAAFEGIEKVGEIAGLFSPWATHNGLAEAWDAGGTSTIELSGAWPLAYLGTALVVCAACLALLVRRFVKVGSR